MNGHDRGDLVIYSKEITWPDAGRRGESKKSTTMNRKPRRKQCGSPLSLERRGETAGTRVGQKTLKTTKSKIGRRKRDHALDGGVPGRKGKKEKRRRGDKLLGNANQTQKKGGKKNLSFQEGGRKEEKKLRCEREEDLKGIGSFKIEKVTSYK